MTPDKRGHLKLKTKIEIDDIDHDLEIFTIQKRDIQEIKLDENVYTKEEKVNVDRRQEPDKRGRPAHRKTKLIDWISTKGKRTWDIKDYFEQYPERLQNKTRIEKELSDLCRIKKIIQLGKTSFRTNI